MSKNSVLMGDGLLSNIFLLINHKEESVNYFVFGRLSQA